MKRKLLIILAFLPLSLFSQYQTANLIVLLNGQINKVDSTLFDSVSQSYLSNYKLWNYQYPIDSNFIAGSVSGGSIIVNGDTIGLDVFTGLGQRNFNDADTFFIQTLDTDDKRPQRVQRIAHYSTPTPDVNNFFNALVITPTMITVCASGCDYTTWGAAVSAASPTDTIVIYEGLYPEAVTSIKELTHIGLGNTEIHPVTGRPFYQTANTFYMHGLKLISNNNFGLRTSIDAAVYPVVNNVKMEGTLNLFNTTDNNDSITLNNCTVIGQLNNYGKIVCNEVYFPEFDYIARFRGTLKLNNSVMESQANQAILWENGIDSIIIDGSKILGDFIVQSINNDTIEVQVSNSILKGDRFYYKQFTGGQVNMTYDSCEFIRSVWDSDFYIDVTGDGDVSFINCYSDSLAGNFTTFTKDVANAEDYNFLIDSCRFENVDTSLNITANNYQVDINNSDFTNNNITIDNSDEPRHLGINNNNFLNPDSTAYKWFNGFTTLRNSYFQSDTSIFITFNTTFPNDSALFILNNEFDINTSSEITMISVPTSVYANRYQSGIEITGNKFTMPGFYGKYQPLHMYLIFNNSTLFNYNEVTGGTTTCVTKDNLGNDISNIIHHNIFINCTTPIFLRSMPNSKIYNNAFYDDLSVLSEVLFIDNNNGFFYSDSAQFINNIVFSNTGNYIYFDESGDSVGFNSSNNVVYNDLSVFVATNETTFTQWQGLGYDANSYDTDPNFKSSTQLWPISPSDAFANGLNLGNDYKTGLDISSVWPDNVVLKNQISDWIIGAYVVIRPAISTFNNGYWIYNGGYVILK